MTVRLSMLSLIGVSLILVACGKQTELQRPPGPGAAAERARQDELRRDSSAEANKPSQPGSARETIDPATSVGTIRESPIPGSGSANSGPTGPGFPGAPPR